jgi:hypothetical protein
MAPEWPEPPKPLRAIDPAALRAFSRRFPGVTLTGFFALNQMTPVEHMFRFEGDVESLLHLGLIEERTVPPRPKRKAYSENGEDE